MPFSEKKIRKKKNGDFVNCCCLTGRCREAVGTCYSGRCRWEGDRCRDVKISRRDRNKWPLVEVQLYYISPHHISSLASCPEPCAPYQTLWPFPQRLPERLALHYNWLTASLVCRHMGSEKSFQQVRFATTSLSTDIKPPSNTFPDVQSWL